MSRNAIKISENLVIRRIDPVAMLQKYLAGEFKNVAITKDSVTLSKAFTNLNQRVGSDQTSEIYRFNDKTNSGQLIVTTNQEQYEYAKDKKGDQPYTECLWCRREIKTKPIRIPIEMEKDKYSGDTIFRGNDDTFDNFGCALAALKHLYSCHYMYKDPLYMDAEQMLHCLYHMMHPDKMGTRIIEARNWKLLKPRGPLTDEEFDNEQYGYVELPNVVVVPTKRQFIKLSLGKK